jgi:hypothetical protein
MSVLASWQLLCEPRDAKSSIHEHAKPFSESTAEPGFGLDPDVLSQADWQSSFLRNACTDCSSDSQVVTPFVLTLAAPMTATPK